MAFKDQYILQPSGEFTVTGRTEVDQGLELFIAPETGNISGTVHDTNGGPISNAVVKIFTIDNIPFEHTDTNSDGEFIFDQVPAGRYTITASKDGYLTPTNILVVVIETGSTQVDLVMQVDTNTDTLTIYGIISDVGGQAIEGATIELFLETETGRNSVGIVTSNTDGQYLFTELGSGTYIITAIKFGYLPYENWIGSLTQPGFYSRNVPLIIDPNYNTGTISGVVKDHVTGKPVANAIVALYSVSGSTETIVNITRTNANGMYLFGDILTGTFIVKATVQKTV